MRVNSWTAEEERWLAEMFPHHHNDTISAMHSEAFPDRPARTTAAVNSRGKAMGLRKSEEFKRNRSRMWDDEKLAWLRENVPGRCDAEVIGMFEERFGVRLTPSQLKNAKVRFKVRSGTNSGVFRKGSVPWNKGRKWDEFMSPEAQEACRRICFKQGEVHGPEGHVKPVGYERVDAKDGYVHVKVKDTPQLNVKGHFNDNFRPKHHVVWEQANGRPVPPKTMIVFADHDKRNFDPANLVAVPRELWVVISRSGLRYFDAESLGVCMNIAKVARARHAAQRRPRECGECGRAFEPRFASQRRCDRCLGREGA